MQKLLSHKHNERSYAGPDYKISGGVLYEPDRAGAN